MRRLGTISLVSVGLALTTLTMPLALPAALLVDAVRSARRPPVAARMLLFAWVYLAAEVAGVTWLGLLWLRVTGERDRVLRRRRLADGAADLQRRWTAVLLGAATGLFRLRFQVDFQGGAEEVVSGPAVVLIRHCSVLDTLLPSVYLSGRHGVRLRFVLKRELLLDPCLDIAGHFMPNYFVRRDSPDPAAEIAGVRALAAGVSALDWALIYPEGTRFSAAKRARVLDKLRAQDPQTYEHAARLKSVLPLQLGGALALLDGAPQADVVFFAHHGLEVCATLADLWSGRLVGRTISLRLWRVRRADIPAAGGARVDWLYDEWERLDRWVRAQEQGPTAAAGALEGA